MKPLRESPESILKFWYREIKSDYWFKQDNQLDQYITKRFTAVHDRACVNEGLSRWRQTPEGRLAEIIILDQFSRNIYRNQPKAFAQDGRALKLARLAITVDADKHLSQQERWFLYMPFMHSESSMIHQEAVPLFESLGLENVLKYEHQHKAIIDRFGRYPHRNTILGRTSTPEEEAFLQEENASF